MTTFARLWLILATSYVVAGGLLAVVVLHTIDLRFEILIQYAVVPFVQAAVLAWLAGAISPRRSAQELWSAIRMPLVAGLWSLAAILLGCYWLPGIASDLTRLLLRVAGLEAVTAAILIIAGFLAGAGLWRVTPFALLMTLFASNAVVPWLGALPKLLPSGLPLLVRQAIVLWVLLLVVLAAAAAAGTVVRSRNRTSASFLSPVGPLAIAAALAVSLNWSFYSYPTEPWIHFFVTIVLIGASTILAAAILLHAKPQTSPVDDPPAVGGSHEIGFIGLWAVLTLTSVTGLASLFALVQGQWDWGATTWLSLTMPPLVQAAWVRISRHLRALPSAIRVSLTEQPRRFWQVVLVVIELIVIFWFWDSTRLADIDGDQARSVLAAYAAIKVVVLGATIVLVIRRRNLGSSVLGALAAMTSVIAVGSGLSAVSMWLPVVGLLFVRWALAAGTRYRGVTGFHISAVDFFLAPAILLGVGDLVSPTQSTIVAAPLALSMVVFAASAAAVGLQAWVVRDGSGQQP